MNLEQVFENNVAYKITNCIKEQKEGFFYFIPNKTAIFRGYNNLLDENLCKELNLDIIELNNEGGIIVSGKDSIAIGLLSKNIDNKYNEMITNILVDYLKQNNINVDLMGNDILIDNKYKVASSSTRRFGDILFSAFHISFNVDLDLINKLCKKPMVKVPKGLDDYNINKSELSNIIINNIRGFI